MSVVNARAQLFVAKLNQRLKHGWSAHLNKDGRIYYCNHGTQTSSWLPPAENWDTSGNGLPYGWESATDKEGRQYFINHVNKTTTYEDPRKEVVEEPPLPREVELIRDQEMGFGFVAGSEKPVIVRFVTEGGPSVDKLLPGDQILKINGEDVKKAPREHVIELVRSCKHSVFLTVCQPHTTNSTRKSALLSAAKKAKLKSNPSRVRFAEGVVINGSPLLSPSSYSTESCIPFMPNVLKVFLENGQTKSFKYDSSTTVQDVVESLQQKLSIKCLEHFSLVVEHIKSLRRNKLTLLDPQESLARIAARPSAQHLRCLFRVAFVPKDAYDLLRKDPISFEYLYMQCCNDVVQERFAPELKYDIALRLAALHIQQHALTNNIQGKLSVKTIERECGLERFVPLSLVETMKRKELRKLLSHFFKLNQNLCAPGQKSLSALQAKLHYLKIISELPSYGAKCFTTNLRVKIATDGLHDSHLETVLLVSPKFGISQIPGIRNSSPLTLSEIEDLSAVIVIREDELTHRVELQLKDPELENIVLSLEDRDADELVLLLQGYYRLLTDKELPVHQERDRWTEDAAPPYLTQHRVQAAGWSYPPSQGNSEEASQEQNADLATIPPYQASPQKVVAANGHLPTGDSLVDDSADTVASKMVVAVDRNMNERKVETDNSVPRAPPIPPSPKRKPLVSDANRNIVIGNSPAPMKMSIVVPGPSVPPPQPPVGFDFQSVISMEMLEDRVATLEEEPLPDPVFFVEAKNDEVIRRVVEMQQIVHDAEKYLTTEDDDEEEEQQVEPPETALAEAYPLASGTEHLLPPPTLKAADSLLLLTQVGRDPTADLEGIRAENEPSGSDTDSMSTPTDSPSHKPDQRRAVRPISGLVGASFGLHSPDNLPASLHKADLQGLLRKLQEQNQLPYPFAEGTLYLDPDIIDLTMIPPPITPDREAGPELPLAISMPPTPFADRQTLEAELRVLEAQFNKEAAALASLPSPITTIMIHSKKSEAENHGINSKPNLLFSQTGEPKTLPNSQAEELASPPPPPPQGWGSGDIDSFIASVAVPPPPSEIITELTFPEHSPVVELTPEDISAFIIPPPPASSSSDSECEIINRFQEAAKSISKVVDEPKQMKHTGEKMRAANKGDIYLESHFGDSSGYDTQASSITSYADIREQVEHQYDITDAPQEGSTYESLSDFLVPGQTFNDDASIISGGSSSTSGGTECAGTQGDTEDSATEEQPNSPRLPQLGRNRTTRKIPGSPAPPSFLLSGSKVKLEGESGSDGEMNAIHHSRNTSSSDEGTSHLNPSPFKRQMSIPRSFTSPLISKRAQLMATKFQRSKSISNENLMATSPSDQTNTCFVDPSSTLSVSSENVSVVSKHPAPKTTSFQLHKPTSPKTVMETEEDSASNTGTILKSPRIASKRTVAKPPLPPPPQESIRSPKCVRSPHPDIKKIPVKPMVLANGSQIPHVPKPILPVAGAIKPVAKMLVIKNKEESLEKGNINNNTDIKSHSCSQDSKESESTFKENGESYSKQFDPSSVSPKQGIVYNGNTSPTLSAPKLFSDKLETYDTESLEENILMRDAPFQKAEAAVAAMLAHLDEVLDHCGQGNAAVTDNCREKLASARDSLVAESRRFVTASKLFVKSATETEDRLLVNLSSCVALLDHMLHVTETLATNTVSPLQTQNLALKVRDVAVTYIQTIQAASHAVGKPMNDPSMNVLMQQATTLAAVLTALMRTLRAFNP